MKDIESSVTLKDGWRKVLLPALDLKKEKENMAKYATEQNSAIDSVEDQ